MPSYGAAGAACAPPQKPPQTVLAPSEFQFARTEEPLVPSWAASTADEDEPSPFAFTGAPTHMQAIWESQVSRDNAQKSTPQSFFVWPGSAVVRSESPS